MSETENNFLKRVVIGSARTSFSVTILLQIFRLILTGSFGLWVSVKWFIVLYIIVFIFSYIKYLFRRNK